MALSSLPLLFLLHQNSPSTKLWCPLLFPSIPHLLAFRSPILAIPPLNLKLYSCFVQSYAQTLIRMPKLPFDADLSAMCPLVLSSFGHTLVRRVQIHGSAKLGSQDRIRLTWSIEYVRDKCPIFVWALFSLYFGLYLRWWRFLHQQRGCQLYG